MLLINENLAVSRIINLIAHKESLEVEEFENLNSVIKDRYDFILIDNDSYKDGMISEIKGRFKYKKLIFIAPKNGGKPLGFDEILFKPFLPIDFLRVIGKVPTEQSSQKLTSTTKRVKKRDEEEKKIDKEEEKRVSKKEIEKELIAKKIKSQIEDSTKEGIEYILSNREIIEVLKDLEIDIKITFNFKSKERGEER